MPETTYLIDLEPVGRRVRVAPGTNLLEAAQRAGVDLVASCGGIGICGTCLVRVVQGRVTPLSLTEEGELSEAQVSAGLRLACQTEPLGDVRVDIPPESLTAAQQMQVEGREGALALQPLVVPVDLALEPPSLEDLRSDSERIDSALAAQGLGPLQASLELHNQLARALRENGWRARCAVRPRHGQSELVAVLPPAILPPGPALAGLAVDIGSTKLAIYLVDLASGATLARAGVMNPQIAYGEDVVSRIAFALRAPENAGLLQSRLVEAINDTLAGFCQELGLLPEQVVDVVAVGNTAIHHLFCGLPVEPLGNAPYVPVVSAPLDFPAASIGLRAAPGAQVFMPANIAGYVGADHVAALLATQTHAARQTTLLVDIGTNTEVSLAHEGQIYSCSCASGPAFEGAHIHDGMRAAPGAIDRVRIQAEEVELSTIGGQPPVGICGSGILQAVAQMFGAGVIDERGVVRPGGERVRARGRTAEYVLATGAQTGHGREIVVTRKDINEIQLAKGAIRAGIEILLQEAGIPADAVQAFIIAGAFGTYLDVESALQVGMFPRLPLERYHQVGNAAGVGAKELLLSGARRAEAARVAGEVRYIELTTHPDFTPRFVEAMYFQPPAES